jgi:hypothetical protein
VGRDHKPDTLCVNFIMQFSLVEHGPIANVLSYEIMTSMRFY